jgi:hypothetical protein
MRKSDKWTNLILALLAAVLLAICVASIVRQMQADSKQTETEYGGK